MTTSIPPRAGGHFALSSRIQTSDQSENACVVSRQEYLTLTEGQRPSLVESLRDVGLGAFGSAMIGLFGLIMTRRPLEMDGGTVWTTGEVLAVATLAALVLIGLALFVIAALEKRKRQAGPYERCVEALDSRLGIERAVEPDTTDY